MSLTARVCVYIFKQCVDHACFPTILYANFIMIFVQTRVFEKLNVLIESTITSQENRKIRNEEGKFHVFRS